MSVAKLTEAGNSVHLTSHPHILNEKTKERTALRKEGNVFVVDLWVKVPPPPGVTGSSKPRRRAGEVNGLGFTRQGR